MSRKAGLLATPRENLLPYLADSKLGGSREPGKTDPANPVLGWVQLASPTWTEKKPEHRVQAPALVFTIAGTLGKSGGLLEPQSPHLCNGMSLLTLCGFCQD